MFHRLVVTLIAAVLLAACGGPLKLLRSVEIEDQRKGLAALEQEKDPGVWAEAIPELFKLLAHKDPAMRRSAFEALEAQKVEGEKTALDLYPRDSGRCIVMFNLFMSTIKDYPKAKQARIVQLTLGQSCVDADDWLKEQLNDARLLSWQIRSAKDLATLVRVFDLASDKGFEGLSSEERRYANAAYVLWMADFYLTTRVGGGALIEYARVLDTVNASKRELTAALKARAAAPRPTSVEVPVAAIKAAEAAPAVEAAPATAQPEAAASGAEPATTETVVPSAPAPPPAVAPVNPSVARVRAAMKKVNEDMMRLVELEPGVKAKLDPIREETITFLLHAASLSRLLTEAGFKARLTGPFMSSAQLKSAPFIQRWFDELVDDLTAGRRSDPENSDAPGKIQM